MRSWISTSSPSPPPQDRRASDEKRVPRAEPGTSAFASGALRGQKIGGASAAEPGYSTLQTDQALWNRHANRQGKGYSFPKLMRWDRPPGPGSNRPADVGTPGPGAYGSVSLKYPEKGFKGSARGFNHNA